MFFVCVFFSRPSFDESLDINNAQQIRGQNDTVVLVVAISAAWPQDLKIPGCNVNCIHFMMEVCDISLSKIFKAILKFLVISRS